MEGIFVKIRWILKDPSDFFAKLYQESHIRDSAMYLMIMTFVSSLLNYILSLSSDASLGLFRKWFYLNLPLVGSGPVKLAILGLIYIICLIILSFVAAFLLQCWLYIFGVRANYTRSYQLLSYVLTPTYILGWTNQWVSLLTWVWVFALLVIGSRNMFSISRKKAWLMFTLPALFVVVAISLILLWIAQRFLV